MRAGTKAGPDAALDASGARLDELEALLAILADWVFVLRSGDATVLRLGAAAEQRFGEHWLGASFPALIALEDRPLLARALQALQSGVTQTETLHVTLTGDEPRTRVELRLQSALCRGECAVMAVAREASRPPYQGLFRRSSLALAISDADDRFVAVSEGFERLLDQPSARLIGKQPAELGILSSDAGLTPPSDTGARPDPDFAILDFSVDGEPRAALQLTSEIAHSEAPQRFCVAFDITAASLLRDQLHEQDQRFRALFDNVADGMFFIGEDGRFFDVNHAACEQLGYMREELIGLSVATIVGREGFVLNESVQRVLAQGTAAYETLHRHKDGTLIPVHLTLAPVTAAGRRAVAGIAHDLSDQKRIEAELRDARDRMQAILQAMPDLLFEIAEDGTIFEFFSSRPELLSIPPERFLGKRIHDVSHPEAVEAVMRGITEALAQGFSTGVQYRVLVGTPRERWMELSAAMRKDIPGDQRPRAIAIVRDITQRKLHEQELERKNDELMRFAYTISHDLRTPLVTIQSFLGYLIRDLRTGQKENIDRDLYHIQRAAERMDVLLKDLLELSRVGRKVHTPERVSLRALVREAAELVAGRIEAAQARIVGPTRDAQLWGDRERLLEVFQNLLDNAVKFSSHLAAPPVIVEAEWRAGETVISVRDEGLGVDPRHRHKLFGLFEKLHPELEGTGIGLALVKRIIDTHGGRVWLESAGEHQGTTVCFTLPQTTLEPTT